MWKFVRAPKLIYQLLMRLTKNQSLWLYKGPDSARLGYRVFSRDPDPPQQGPVGPVQGLGPIRGPTKKKKKILSPDLFFPTFKSRFIFAVQACIFQIKKLSPNLFLPTFKLAYSNSSLNNVTQMPNHRLLIINQ